jgi:FkbM family methyltransferase
VSLRTRVIQKLISINENLVFYPRLRKFYARVLPPEVTVVDVGSNKGQSIDFFLGIRNTARIYGFEPNRKLFEKLQSKYHANPRIVLQNKGVSAIDGELLFHENILDETSTFEAVNTDSKYLEKKARILGVEKSGLITGSYKVPVTTLSSFLAATPDLRVDVLKIDVEGHEYQALKGLFSPGLDLRRISYIQLESHNDDMYLTQAPQEIDSLLKENGFSECARFRHGFGDFYEIIYRNNRNFS